MHTENVLNSNNTIQFVSVIILTPTIAAGPFDARMTVSIASDFNELFWSWHLSSSSFPTFEGLALFTLFVPFELKHRPFRYGNVLFSSTSIVFVIFKCILEIWRRNWISSSTQLVHLNAKHSSSSYAICVYFNFKQTKNF